ncbi:mucin-2-like isoform X2 [Ruditapes philippinarum]|uniref:mucin-2-like isoform X2 n=1 Tax=Ruditapes philippinarum TaxID=129788 RepID=UPI00295B8CB4|nr:mucin-2-like isoform X2 [Ruditapes philippinarum]
MFVFLLLPLIAVTGVSGQFALSFGTSAPPGPKSFDPNCIDKMDTCWKMPQSNCEKPYEEWAQQYCPNRCGYCLGPTTPAPACVNKLPNCESYDKSVCTDPDYRSWAGENCRYFCRMCSQAELLRLDSITTTIKPEDCVDKVDCRQYGTNACSKSFEAWSKDNCANYCGFCKGLPTPPPVCEDKIPNCKAYNPSTCTDPQFKMWVEDNCQKFCGLCGNPTLAPPLINSPGKNSPTISYITAAPPLPGKRSKVSARSKRQFHASHHHGMSHDCLDATSNDPLCNTEAPTERETTLSSLVDSTGFPGSEFHPHQKPDNNWDSKPSTAAPSTTTTTAATTTTTEATTTHAKPPIATNHATPTRQTQSTESPSTTTAPTTVTDAPTTTTAPPMTTTKPTTTTAPPTVTEEPSTTTVPPTTTEAATTTPKPETPSTTVLAVKTPGSRSTSSSTDTQTDSTAATTSTGPTTTSTTQTNTPPTVPSTAPPTAPPMTQAPPLSNTAAQTTSTTTVGTTTEACRDTVDNCAMYGKTACESGVYRPWAKAHCSVFCGFCVPVTLTPFHCQDKLANCKEFDGGDLCTADSYFAWARENCFNYCGFPPCGNNTGIVVTTTADAPSSAVLEHNSTDSNCTDKLDNCISYPDEKCVGIYEPWARSQCAYRCGYCEDFLPCEDANPDCDKFPPESCTRDSFKGWARQNCRQFCNMCARPTQNPSFTGPTGTSGLVNTTHPTPEIPHSSVDPVMLTSPKP